MKLFINAIFIITILLISGYSKEAYSQPEQHSVDATFFYLTEDIENLMGDISFDINQLIFFPGLLQAFGDDDFVECGYNQETKTELEDMKHTMTSLREEFDENALEFFYARSDVYFALFRARLEYIRERLHSHLSNIVHCTYEHLLYDLKTFTFLTPGWGHIE